MLDNLEIFIYILVKAKESTFQKKNNSYATYKNLQSILKNEPFKQVK